MDKLDLPQQLIILYLSFQKHKSQAWTRWIMHFQSLLVLHGLQEKSKGITPWSGRQGAVHQELLGAQRVVLNHSLGTALPNKPNSSHLLRVTPPHFPHRRMQAKQPLPPPWGHCTHRFPEEEEPGTTYPQHCCSCHSLPPQQSIIHLSGISPANLAKQKCCFFNTSRNQELWGEKLMINSLLSAVVIYLQEWQGCCHVN